MWFITHLIIKSYRQKRPWYWLRFTIPETQFWLQTTPLTPQPTSPVPTALFILDSSSHESLSHCKIIGLDVIFHCNSLEYQTSTKHRYLVRFSTHFKKLFHTKMITGLNIFASIYSRFEDEKISQWNGSNEYKTL